ncbi:MAG: hypothetical protein PHS41_03195 [Victivallaceae bacterium]|nr:hypothetical protein [Victivallaceae bacterium]
MRNLWRYLTTAVSFVPLASMGGYLWRAWSFSPMDQWNMLYVLLALPLALWGMWRIWKHTEIFRIDRMGILPILIGVGVFWFGRFRGINLLALFGALAIPAGTIWLVFSWRILCRLLPAFLFLGMGVLPSSALTSMLVPPLAGWNSFKLLGAAITILVTTGFVILRRPVPSPGRVCFSLLLLAVLSANWLFPGIPPVGKALHLRMDRLQLGEYIGVSSPPSDFDRRFFEGCRSIRRISYFRKDASVGLLGIESGGKVNAIHPARVCLLSAGWKVLDVRPMLVRINARMVACEDLLAERNGQKYLFRTWYSDRRISTGDFFGFRRRWHAEDQWMIYQLMTPMREGSEPEEAFADFMTNFDRLKEGENGGTI